MFLSLTIISSPAKCTCDQYLILMVFMDVFMMCPSQKSYEKGADPLIVPQIHFDRKTSLRTLWQGVSPLSVA